VLESSLVAVIRNALRLSALALASKSSPKSGCGLSGGSGGPLRAIGKYQRAAKLRRRAKAAHGLHGSFGSS